MSDYLASLPTKELIGLLNHAASPGAHTYATGECGHTARGGGHCADCLDSELQRRGIDVTKGGSAFAYERFNGHIRRKMKGTQP